ncbi:MAG TPA: EamA family transporter [Candidatus Acidoferrales bacterium]|nr:EamA family transporter [Candidatus Acidoferrales bacterium]
MTWLSFAFISAILSATAAVTQKKILFKIDALTFSFLLSAVIMIMSFGALLIVDVTDVSGITLAILILKGVINAFAFVLVMMMLERSDISGTLPLLALTPGITAVLAFAAIGETITAIEMIGLLLMIGGVLLLERRPTGLGNFRAQRYIWAALLLFAVSAVMDKVLVSGYKTSPIVVLFYQHAVFLVVYVILFFNRRNSLRQLLTRKHIPVLLLIGLVALFTIGYRLTQLDAVKTGNVAMVLAVKRTSVFYASLIGGKMFSEKHLLIRLAGAAVIIAAGFIILRNVA